MINDITRFGFMDAVGLLYREYRFNGITTIARYFGKYLSGGNGSNTGIQVKW
jgi:hypothetical protein